MIISNIKTKGSTFMKMKFSSKSTLPHSCFSSSPQSLREGGEIRVP